MRNLIKVFVYCFALLILSGAASAAVVIQYHHVDSETPPATSISPALFTQHMEYLARHDFKVWPLPQLLTALKQGETLPDKVIAITFDDGYLSVYRNALSVLSRYHFPATVFINTQLVGKSGYMSWDELQDMATQGHTIANHTATHPHLVRLLDNESMTHWQGRIKEEIVEAERVIRHKMGTSAKLLAYPYGEYNDRVKTLVREAGLIAFAQHSGAFDQHVDWQAIPRFAFGGQYAGMQSFSEKVNSLPMPLIEVVVSDGQGQRLVDPLLPDAVSRPVLSLQVDSPVLARAVRCYASGQGSIEVNVNGNTVTTEPEKVLPVGRSRINCTASSEQHGRFYWYSAFFMRTNPDGSWYTER